MSEEQKKYDPVLGNPLGAVYTSEPVLKHIIAQQEEQNKQLQAELAAWDGREAVLIQRLDEAQAAHQDAYTPSVKLMAEGTALRQELNDVRGDLGDAEAQADRWHAEAARLREENADLREQLAHVETFESPNWMTGRKAKEVPHD